ncbi:MAG: DNA-processing protein DprA [FCB group bacterium]|jgi:DNA processing protein|nr:DNA-processing protein DprA [FCB group bacterium]
MTNEPAALLALLLTGGIGNVTAQRILAVARARGKRVAELAAAPVTTLTEWLPSGFEALAAPLRASRRHHARAKQLLDDMRRAGGKVLCAGHDGYPAALESSLGEQAPIVVFCRGELDVLREATAGVVGTRMPSARGLRLGRACTAELVNAGATIVSGGADGIDTAAHGLALEASGKTVVVLPQGLLTYRIPDTVREALDNGRALLLSQFSPLAPWATHAAVTRNATIAALSRLVCVVEPNRTGGSMRTGHCGLEQGKPVFCAVNARLPDSGRLLIRAGAEPLADDRDNLRKSALLSAWKTAATAAKLSPQRELF